MAEDLQPTGEPAEPSPPRRRSRRKLLVRVGAILLGIVIGVLVSVFAVDLGPGLRARAEREGSKYLDRPLTIGRLSARLIPGVFVVEDVRIGGLEPSHRPFLTAKTITVRVPWWTVLTRKLTVESVDMTDWHMLVEAFPNNRHSFPRFTRGTQQPGPRRFTTTLKSLTASRGQFTYEDHVTPWTTVARDLNLALYRSFATSDYRGRASFSNGTIRIQSYEPFRADMQSRFRLDGSLVRFERIDLVSDGARSTMDGTVDMARWPQQTYNIRSAIDFARQKEIFFHRDRFTASGHGDFRGTFRMFPGGRELKGSFTSPVAGVNEWRFPKLRGDVLWLRDRLEVTNATSEVYGGTASFDYRLAPFGKGVPTLTTWDVAYKDVDLVRLTDFLETEGIRLAGRASGRNHLTWPLGGWARKQGRGEAIVSAPRGVETMTRRMPASAADAAARPPEAGPFNARSPLGHVPIAGRIVYTLDPEWIALDNSWVATPKTYVEFRGRTAYGERSTIPFHVTSADWQESDRVLAGIMTAFGASTGAIPISGYGEFDGVMLNAFTRPRIEGFFSGEQMRAWDVVWGSARTDLVIENGYAFIKHAALTKDGSEIVAAGQFSLGYPRRDSGEEINARVKLSRRPLRDLRHAFELDDYPVDGLVSGEYHVYGNYETPFGVGRLLIEDGVAYGETFDSAQATLRFEGAGVRLDGLTIAKSTGTATGAAWVGWDGNYSFNVDGRRIPVESLANARVPRAPLSGLLQFNATGAGTFESPRYDVKLRVDDLFAGDEGIGQLTARLALRGDLLTADLEAASPRLSVSGSGRLALTPEMDAELSLRFADTSLDPYLRFIEPRLSPFTTAVAGGTIRVMGELADIDHLVIDTQVERLDLKLFDYPLKNDGPIHLVLDRHTLEVERLRLVGEGTLLELGGNVLLHEGNINLEAKGDANLGILQGFFRNLRSRGSAALSARIGGAISKPVFSGSARISDGRVRHMAAPHALEAINGTISFDAGGVRIEEMRGRLGEGLVEFGGRLALNGFAPGELSLTATGERMRVRFPEGFRSIVDADLWLRGTAASPILGGNVTVRDAVWSRRFEVDPNIFDLGGGSVAIGAGPAAPAFPLRFDLEINAPSSLRIENNIAHVVSSAELKLQGTYDRPLLFGHAEIERGDIVFEGNRYLVTRGSIDFLNPGGRIEPLFDIEAQTRVRVPAQTYQVTLNVNGTPNRFSLTLGSDPPLPEIDIVGLLFGQTAGVADAELRALRPEAATQTKEALIRALGARLVASPISGPVRRVVEETFGLDTAQVAPTIGSETDPLTPSARLILGKRLSPRAFLTFSRALGTADRSQIIQLEYDQSDRLGFVITQIGDRTFAVDLRVRRSF
ncbi:MAG TPA: translocation/assembly module TamB domain-containing protein [Vicinamibacterales bacterium]|nr:translocation/assembly module TamB domain-containing protein [Vicinamibacterales bacterium]